jgi:conjugative transfer signal peptidase TraF
MIARRSTIVALTTLASLGLVAGMVFTITPRLVWNGSNSAPVGLYLLGGKRVQKGEFVLVHPPDAVVSLISSRGYLPLGMPLLKRVVALAGDEVCRKNNRILINGELAAIALTADAEQRKMPQWQGCIILRPAEIFLLNNHPNSFDGRYFGAIESQYVIGVATPLWVRTNNLERELV